MLKGKNIVLGVTGGVAAWKSCLIINKLVLDLHANVDVIMTKNAETFICEQTLRSLSRNLVIRDMFREPGVWSVEHISLARKADLFLIAPGTANCIGKIANGIADDMLTTTVMATRAPVVIAPAMNDKMYTNPIVQENMQKLARLGYIFIEPHEGVFAAGGVGIGELATADEIARTICEILKP
jgi:phosphopantothenoylcysteine decarboxylase/phosphopantothenate--cysteine ligase